MLVCVGYINAPSLLEGQHSLKTLDHTVETKFTVEVMSFFFSTNLGVSVATCMAILQVGSGLQLRSAATGSKEEDYENDAATIVQKCVSIISTTNIVQ